MFDIFSLPDFQMPKDFLWGAGYAGHQVEGNNIHSQNWKKEIDQHYAERSGLACNSYELWKTDVDLAEQTGLQAFRTSVEWSRIEPEEGHFDQKVTSSSGTPCAPWYLAAELSMFMSAEAVNCDFASTFMPRYLASTYSTGPPGASCTIAKLIVRMPSSVTGISSSLFKM